MPDPTIGEALRLIRRYHDMTAKDFAAAIAFSRSQISAVESGKKTPSLKLMYAYSEYFSVDLSSIWGFAEFIRSEGRPRARLIKFAETFKDIDNA